MTTLLVVDDDPTIRAMFKRALGGLGQVEEASGGAQAQRMLSTQKFDLVVLDLNMPHVDGFAVLESLEGRQGLNRETPILVVTADDSEQVRVRALRRRAVFLMSKPVSLAMLVSLAGSSLKKAASRAPAQLERAKKD